MTTQTTEQAFETTVESMLLGSSWRAGDLAEWDVDRALFPDRVVAFIRDTQPDEWARVANLYGDDLEARIVEILARELDTKGVLDVLRHGFRFLRPDVPTRLLRAGRTASTRTPSPASSATS